MVMKILNFFPLVNVPILFAQSSIRVVSKKHQKLDKNFTCTFQKIKSFSKVVSL